MVSTIFTDDLAVQEEEAKASTARVLTYLYCNITVSTTEKDFY